MAETLIQKAQRLGIQPVSQPKESLVQKAQRLGIQPEKKKKKSVLGKVAGFIAPTATGLATGEKKLTGRTLLGAGLEIGSFLIPAGAVARGAGAVAKGARALTLGKKVKTAAKLGAATGATFEAGRAIGDEDATAGQIALRTAGGAIAGGIGGAAIPASGRAIGLGVKKAKKIIPQIPTIPSRAGGAVSETILGTKGERAIRAGFSQPKIQEKIIKGEITTGTISKKIGALAQSSRQKSIKKLQTSRAKITGNVKGTSIASRINKVMSSAKDRPFLPEEQQIVNKLIQLLRREIKVTGSVSKKKLDVLIQRIDDAGFFKKGAASDKFSNSNKVVNAIRKELREITKQGNPKFTKLLEKSSKVDIPFFEKLGKNIVGKDGNLNVDLLQNKINQLISAIDDPNKRQESLKLLRELAKRSGAKGDFMNELEVFARSQILTRDISGIGAPLQTIRQHLTKGGGAAARKAGTFFGR